MLCTSPCPSPPNEEKEVRFVSFFYYECSAIVQTGDNAALDCHMHWALHGARGRTALDNKNTIMARYIAESI